MCMLHAISSHALHAVLETNACQPSSQSDCSCLSCISLKAMMPVLFHTDFRSAKDAAVDLARAPWDVVARAAAIPAIFSANKLLPAALLPLLDRVVDIAAGRCCWVVGPAVCPCSRPWLVISTKQHVLCNLLQCNVVDRRQETATWCGVLYQFANAP